MKLKFLISAIVALLVTVSSFAQTTEKTYYVIVGVFSVHENAVRYTASANKNNFSAQYAINPARKLYFVYLYSSTDKVKAIAFMLKIKVETIYKDAWVFSGALGDSPVDVGNIAPTTSKLTPVIKHETPPAIVVPEEKKIVPEDVTKTEEVKKDSIVATIPVTKSDTTEAKLPVVEKPVVETPAVVVKHEGVPFNFKLVNQESGNQIVGEVHVQMSSRAAQYQAFKGNEVVYLKPPTGDGTITIVTNAPGYQQIKETINFKDPSATTGVTKGDQSEFIIPFSLKRAKHGDYIDFNNVKFIRNSSVMTAESQNELDGLVSLMKENVKYKIKVHGHCNGKEAREIIIVGSSQNFFAMDPKNNIKETASAGKLSEERANSVKGYLISQGIDASRIQTKGEGAKIPLYPSTSTLSTYNDRVEIEVKKD